MALTSGFVEIIKQMCPDEAKIVKYFKNHKTISTISVRFNSSYNKIIAYFLMLVNCQGATSYGASFCNVYIDK